MLSDLKICYEHNCQFAAQCHWKKVDIQQNIIIISNSKLMQHQTK